MTTDNPVMFSNMNGNDMECGNKECIQFENKLEIEMKIAHIDSNEMSIKFRPT